MAMLNNQMVQTKSTSIIPDVDYWLLTLPDHQPK